jgi:hypothetical protein
VVQELRGEQPRTFLADESPSHFLVYVLEACALEAVLERPALDDTAALEALADRLVARGAELRAEYEAGAAPVRQPGLRARRGAGQGDGQGRGRDEPLPVLGLLRRPLLLPRVPARRFEGA